MVFAIVNARLPIAVRDVKLETHAILIRNILEYIFENKVKGPVFISNGKYFSLIQFTHPESLP